MSSRKIVLATGEIYHLFNRAVGNEDILISKRNLHRTIEVIDYYRLPQKIKYSKFRSLTEELQKKYLASINNQMPLIVIYAFALMPTHYHLLVRQLADGGLRIFASNFQNSFAKYFNLKNNRQGALFQNPFKAKRVESEEELIHLSRYIHLNPVTSYLIEFNQLSNYPWTSYSWYMDENRNRFLDTKLLIGIWGSREKYDKFVANQVDYQRKLNLIKKLILE